MSRSRFVISGNGLMSRPATDINSKALSHTIGRDIGSASRGGRRIVLQPCAGARKIQSVDICGVRYRIASRIALPWAGHWDLRAMPRLSPARWRT